MISRDPNTIDLFTSQTEEEAMSESGMRSKVVKFLADLDSLTVENPTRPGTPDVNYVEGWIELKWLRDLPVDPLTPVRVPHFTQQQRRWLERRRRHGGRAFVLIQCKREWLLLKGEDAARILGEATWPELVLQAVGYWDAGLDQLELIKCLTSDLD